jgi:hypothetical protein
MPAISRGLRIMTVRCRTRRKIDRSSGHLRSPDGVGELEILIRPLELIASLSSSQIRSAPLPRLVKWPQGTLCPERPRGGAQTWRANVPRPARRTPDGAALTLIRATALDRLSDAATACRGRSCEDQPTQSIVRL